MSSPRLRSDRAQCLPAHGFESTLPLSGVAAMARLLARVGVQGEILFVSASRRLPDAEVQHAGLTFRNARADVPAVSCSGVWAECPGGTLPQRSQIESLVEWLKPGGCLILTSDTATLGDTRDLLPAGMQLLLRRNGTLLAARSPVPDDRVVREHFSRYGPSDVARLLKRMVDIILGGTVLLLTLPLQVLLAIAVRLTSPGPALFRQLRVCQSGRLFTFYKFRTMWIDSPARFPRLFRYQYNAQQLTGDPFKSPEDPRNTNFGRWMRKLSLDELPNLINVVLGHMSMVGPRPDLPDLIRYYSPEELAILAHKPGITGMAQVRGRGNLSIKAQLNLDLHYVHTWSLCADLSILIRTPLIVVGRHGAH